MPRFSNSPAALLVASPVLALAAMAAMTGCSTTAILDEPATLITPIESLTESALVVDTHIDVPFRLYKQDQDVSVATETGDFDYPRARAGGLDAAFMSIYIPADVDARGEAYAFAEGLLDRMDALATAAPDKFVIATCSDDVLALANSERIALTLGMENGGPIAGSMDNLVHFRDRGIRYITLAHSKANHISDSSYDVERKWNGLSEFGKALIPAMNAAGVLVDISHVSDDAFWQALELSAVPVIASHSSLRHFTKGFERNMTDEMVAALGKAGGVVQINYGSSFLTQAAQDYGKTSRAALARFQREQGVAMDSPEAQAFIQQYAQTNPYPFATLDDVLDHIDRAVEFGGIDAVGIGSDYDGVGNTLPVGLKDVASYPNLAAGLRARGYDDESILKILGGNLMRVWQQTEAYAAAAGNAPQCRLAS